MLDEPTLIAGRYTVLRHLGTGGMGTVVLARDERLGREVAIKRVHAGGGADAARRIRREAKLGAGLTHPALVTIYDTLVEDANVVIVMEFVDGETLAERLRRGRFAPAEALAVLRPIAAGLDQAHARGIVHRDVKPANVLLGQRGAVKLADLGVATADDDVSRITRDGALIGSLPYMAPEQFEPQRVTAAADVFGLAAIAFEVLSGRRAREGRTPLELARAATDGPVPDLAAAAPDLPAAAAAVLAAAMARDPSRRPGSAGILVSELEAALTPAPLPEPPPPTPVPARQAPPPRTPPTRSRRRRSPALIGLLALAAVAGALAIVLTAGDGDPDADRAATPTATATAEAPAASPAATAAVAPVAADPSTPEGAVRAFYERAADGDFDGSWALAGPQVRAIFSDDQGQLEGTFRTLESIRFTTLTAGAAETGGGTPVTIETVARHTNFTDRCAGDVLAVPDGEGGYVVDGLGVVCP